MHFDAVIRNGTVIDAVSDHPIKAMVAVRGDSLVILDAAVQGITAHHDIDAKGLVVCPGFIDPHGSSAWRLLFQGGAEPKLFQGVTTEIVGNCGYSEYPTVTQQARVELNREAAAYGTEVTWSDSKSFAAACERAGHLAVNAILAVGLNRIAGEFTAPSILKNELRAAASGLSSGLIYPPGMDLTTDQLVEIARCARGGHHSIHLRNEREHVEDALDEAIKIAVLTSVRTTVSHLKAAETPNWGKMPGLVNRLDMARQAGVAITFEAYPYTSVSTRARAFLPPNLSRLSAEEVSPTLRSEEGRRLAKAYMIERGMDFSRISFTGPALDADNNNQVTVDSFLRKVADDPLQFITYECMSQADVDTALLTEWAMVCTDTWSAPFNKQARSGMHPRTFGGIAKFLHDYSLSAERIPLGKAIKRLTSYVADWYGIARRGRLTTGSYADVVILDPGAYRDTSTVHSPDTLASGVHSVLVNGVPVVVDGERTSRSPGRVLHCVNGNSGG